jgi:hypothetical protein
MAPSKDSRALPPKEEALFRQVLVRLALRSQLSFALSASPDSGSR